MRELLVVIPFNNKDQDGLFSTLNSLQSASFSNFSILLINDSATALHIPSEFNNLRIEIFNIGSNKGISFALKEAERSFNGKYIARVDVGDKVYRERFSVN